MHQIYTVSQLTADVKDCLARLFPYIWIQGEVTNLSRPASGHIYFSLKDNRSSLRCVWFQSAQREMVNPLTGEILEDAQIQNGQTIICAGEISVYESTGIYQLIVDFLQPQAVKGNRFIALENLKKKLDEKGYFRLEHKIPLPENPQKVVVLTAPNGAAIHDFLRLSENRGVGFELQIHPIPVQGDEAPPQIAAAIRQENTRNWAEVLVLIRGGGSSEDLWAFNDEKVADAIFESKIPLLAGIGHQIDYTIADLVADKRASTPSHAAILLWQDRQSYYETIDKLEERMNLAFQQNFDSSKQILDTLSLTLANLAPEKTLLIRSQCLEYLIQNLQSACEKCLKSAEHKLQLLLVRLSAQDPSIPLLKGYALILDDYGHSIDTVKNSQHGSNIHIEIKDGTLDAKVYAVHQKGVK